MVAPRARFLCPLVAASLLFTASAAHAQLHWDASAQAGVMRRVLTNQPTGGEDAGFGPAGQLTAHLALFPLIRLGAYLGHDISPLGGDLSARDLTWGGIRAKIMSPWPRGSVRTWLFVGFGYTGVYARSTSTSAGLIDGAGGGFFEVPFGLGASYTFRKPFALCAELGMRSGFGHSGSAYEDPGPRLRRPGLPDGNALPNGTDRFAIGLTVGIQVDL